MGQHCAPLIRNVKNIPVAFLALLIFEGSIGRHAVFFVVVFPPEEMDDDVLDPMKGLGIEKIERVMGRREVAIHTIRHKTLGVVDVGGCFPGVVGEADFMTGGTELRRGCPNHGIVRDTEDGKGDDEADADENSRLNELLYF